MKLFNFLKKKKKDQEPDMDARSIERAERGRRAGGGSGELSEAEAEALRDAMARNIPEGIDLKTKVESAEGAFYYLIKITNNTNDIMGDVKVAIAPENSIVTCNKPLKTAKFIDPGKDAVFKFKLKPSMRCGKTTIQGMLRYFDFAVKDQQEFQLPEYELNIFDPQINTHEVNEDIWRVTMGKLPLYELETEELDYEPARIFTHLTKIARNMGFYELKPNVVATLYRGTGKYFGVDALKEPYLMEIQVIGKGKTARLLYRVWAADVTAAMGIAYRLLSKVDKRLEIQSRIKKAK